MNKRDIIETVLAFLGPILRLAARLLEPKAPNVARYLNSIGTGTDIIAYTLARA